MARTVVIRLVGAFLLIYGLGAIVMGWWAYSITHEAFTSVRSYISLFDQEKANAANALKGATDLLSGGGLFGSPSSGGGSGSAAAAGSSPAQRAAGGLTDTIRGLLGGSSRPSPAPTPQPGQAAPPPPSGDPLGLLDQLENQLGQIGSGWSALGEGPLRPGLLDRVELATNIVLLWMAIHGAASVVIGFALLLWSPKPAVVPPPGYGQPWPQPYAQPYGPDPRYQYPPPGSYPPPGPPPPRGQSQPTQPGYPPPRPRPDEPSQRR